MPLHSQWPLLRGLLTAALLAVSAPIGAAVSQSQELSAVDHTTDTPLNVPDAHFGQSVAVSGTWMAVGTPADNQAEVAIYERVGSAWVWRTRVLSPSPQAGDGFGSSVDIYESAGLVTLVVGAPQFDSAFAQQGRAYIYSDTNASSSAFSFTTTTINSPSPEANGLFGYAVATYADLAAISEPGDDVTDSGLVTIRGRNTGGTNAWGPLVASKAGNLGNRFGTSVDLHGEYLIIGAPMAMNGTGVRTGQVYVYRQDQSAPNAFGLKHTLTPPTADTGMAFGQSVGIWDSDTAVANSPSRSIVGSPLLDVSGFADVGGVVFYADNVVNANLTHVASSNNVNSHAGYSVAIEGDNAIVGRPSQTLTSQPLVGQVNTYSFNGTVWATNTINLTETGAARGHQYGWSVDVSGLLAVVGAPGSLADALTLPPGARRAGSITTYVKPGPTWAFDSRMVATFDQPFAQPSQYFGLASAISNDWMAVGASRDNQKGADAGAVFMYRNVAGIWVPHSKLTALFGSAGDSFGSSVSLQDNRLIVGAPGANGFPTTTANAGAVYVYVFNGTVWGQVYERQSPNPTADGLFGGSVSLHGNVLAVGARGENGNTGRVYAFRDLTQLSDPIALNLAGSFASGTGYSVSVYDPASAVANDESIAVGAYNENSSAGAAYVLSGPSFASVTTLVSPAPGSNRFFGYSVSLYNGRVAVGAPTATAAPSGATYVFSGAGYTNVATLAPVGGPGQFGFAVALTDTQLLVGAPASNSRAGMANLFARTGSTWAQTDLLQPAGLAALDEFGSSVALENGNYVVGAPLHNTTVADAGVAYVYQQAPEVTVTPTSLAVSETGPTSDSFVVSLNQSPGANVTTTLTFDANVQVNTGSGFGASPQTVTLTAANAVSGVSVSVRAVDDGIAEANPHPGNITTSVTSSSVALFNGLTVADVDVAITDNDTVGVAITQSAGANAVSEAGGTDSYTIVLGSQPSANVDVAITFAAADLSLNGDVDGTYNTTFTTANWSTPQTITIAAVNDRALEGNHAATLTHAFSSADASYNGITATVDTLTSSNDLAVAISDNESATLSWAFPATTAGEGGGASTGVRLTISADPAGGGATLEGSLSYAIAAGFSSAEPADIGTAVGPLSFSNVPDLSTNSIMIPHLDDTLVEGTESYTQVLSLTAVPPGMNVTVAPAPFSGDISDSDIATLVLTAPVTVAESAGSLPLTVTLSTGAPGNTLENPAGVVVNLGDGAATYGGGSGDFAFAGPANTTTLSFPAGSGEGLTRVANVIIREDALAEGDENFSATLGTATGAISNANGATSHLILDNETATVSFQAPSSTAPEGTSPHSVAAPLTITAIGSGTPALERPVTALLTDTPTTATTPGDYSLAATEVMFSAGTQSAATQPITVNIVDDLITDPNETFSLGFGAVSPPGSVSGTHTVTIADNDTPGITVSPSGGSTDVVEGGASDSYSVVLNSQPTADVGIQIVFDPAQVSLNGDTDGSLLLTFTPATASVAQTVTVVAVDDTLIEANPHNTLVVQAANSSDPVYAVINPADVPVSIAENDTQQIVFALASSTAPETVATHTIDARLNLVANGAPGGTLGADMSANVFMLVTTAELADINLTTSQLTFPAGSAHNAVLPINLTLTNDRLLEGAEAATMSLGLVGSLGSVGGSHALTISDDESGAISFSAAGSSTTESAGNYQGAIGRLTISGSGTGGGGFAAEANVEVAINDVAGTATAPADYTRNTAALSFLAGLVSPVEVPVSVSIANDVLIENPETFTLGFGAISGAGNLSASGTHPVSISDNDSAQVAFAPGNDSIGEGAGSFSKPVILTLTANGVGVASLQNALVVPVSFSEGSATEPEDFTLSTPSLSFAAGAGNGASQNATAAIVNDLISEAGETFDLTLGNAFVTANITLGRASTSVTISDNDTPGVAVVQSGGTTAVTEGGATDTLTVALQSQPTADVTVTLTGSQVSAAVSPLVFTSANWNTPQLVTLTAIDDAIDETSPHTGTLSFTVGSSDATYQNFVVAPVTINVTDNDTAGVSVSESSGSTTVTEGGATDSYSVVLTSQPTADVTLVLSTTTQLTPTPSTLVYTATNWNVAQTVTVTAVNDLIVEGPHNASISHGASSNDLGYSGIAVAAVNVAITDNDSAVVGFAPATLSQSEGSSPMLYTITLSNPVASGVSLSLASSNGSASAADYTLTSGATVNFPAASNASQTVTVAINNDALDETDETYTLTLSNLVATGSVSLGANQAVGTILDDDATPTLTISSPSLPEGNAGSAVMNFAVTLSSPSGLDVSFTAATANGSATTANNDYQAVAPTALLLAAGQTSLTIPVTINGDALYEGDETFALNLSAITNATPSTLTGTGTIVEDDQQPTTTTISADLPDPSVTGQSYPVSVTVTAQSSSPLGTVTISDGSASCGPVSLTVGTAPASSASCSLTSSSAGAKTLTASYTPASTAFGASSGTTAHQVNPASTTLSVTGPVRSRIGQPTTFSFALAVASPGAGSPAGIVTLSSGASSCTVSLPSGSNSCALTFTSLGAQTVSAAFAPADGNYLAASSSGAGNAQTVVYAMADLVVSKTDGVSSYQPGDLLVYTLQLRNLGPDAAANLRLLDVLPPELSNLRWTCDASGGAVCTENAGTGSLDLVISQFPVGALLNFSYFGNVDGTPGQIVNTFSVQLPADQTVEDPVLGNNSVSDTDVLSDNLLSDGFESPIVQAPSGSISLPVGVMRSLLDERALAVYRLTDRRGEAARVYARVFDGQLKLALAQRDSSGQLRLGAWQLASGNVTLSWTASSDAAGWLLTGARLN